MASNLNLWLAGISVAYPALLVAPFFLSSRPPWWMIGNFEVIFLVLILPALSAGTLVVLKVKGAHVSWIVIAAFSIWLGLAA
jgi:hypothetical protein